MLGLLTAIPAVSEATETYLAVQNMGHGRSSGIARSPIFKSFDCRNMTPEQEREFKPKCVLLGGADISNRCFRVDMYSDGWLRAHCYRKNGEDFVMTPDNSDVEQEVLEGYGTVLELNADGTF